MSRSSGREEEEEESSLEKVLSGLGQASRLSLLSSSKVREVSCLV